MKKSLIGLVAAAALSAASMAAPAIASPVDQGIGIATNHMIGMTATQTSYNDTGKIVGQFGFVNISANYYDFGAGGLLLSTNVDRARLDASALFTARAPTVVPKISAKAKMLASVADLSAIKVNVAAARHFLT